MPHINYPNVITESPEEPYAGQAQFRRALSNRILETIESLEAALTEALEPYWRDPGRLRDLTGYPWWARAIEKLRHQ